MISTMVIMAITQIAMSIISGLLRADAAEKGTLLGASKREMECGLGQIIAPFSWVPLLMELGAVVVGMIPSRRRDSRPEGWGNGYRMCKGPCCRRGEPLLV